MNFFLGSGKGKGLSANLGWMPCLQESFKSAAAPRPSTSPANATVLPGTSQRTILSLLAMTHFPASSPKVLKLRTGTLESVQRSKDEQHLDDYFVREKDTGKPAAVSQTTQSNPYKALPCLISADSETHPMRPSANTLQADAAVVMPRFSRLRSNQATNCPVGHVLTGSSQVRFLRCSRQARSSVHSYSTHRFNCIESQETDATGIPARPAFSVGSYRPPDAGLVTRSTADLAMHINGTAKHNQRYTCNSLRLFI